MAIAKQHDLHMIEDVLDHRCHVGRAASGKHRRVLPASSHEEFGSSRRRWCCNNDDPQLAQTMRESRVRHAETIPAHSLLQQSNTLQTRIERQTATIAGWIEKRKAIAKRYRELLSDIRNQNPGEDEGHSGINLLSKSTMNLQARMHQEPEQSFRSSQEEHRDG